MNAKNKKIFIISGVVAAIGIIVAIVIAQSKKKVAVSTAPSTAGSTPSTTATPAATTAQPTSTSSTGFAPAATNPAAQTTTTVPTTAPITQPSSSSGVGAYQYVNAFLEGGVLKIQYQPISGRAFSVGDNIKFITGNPFLLGKTARISQVYNFNSGGLISGPGQNLTVDIPYSTSYQNGKGTFDLV